MKKIEDVNTNEVEKNFSIDTNSFIIDKKEVKNEPYTGWYKWTPTSEEWLDFEADGKLPDYMHLVENEYLLVYDESEPDKLNRQYVMKQGKLQKIGRSSIKIKQCGYGSKNTNKTYLPRNDEQVCAFDLIKDRDVPIKLLGGKFGTGKACPNSTLIPTPSGNKLLGDIKVGDYVFNEQGKPTKVLGVFPQGKKRVYELTFNDSRTAKCCNEHLWTVYKLSRGVMKPITLSLQDIINSGYKTPMQNKPNQYSYKYYIPCASAVEYEKKDFKIQPYIFGNFIRTSKSHEERIPIDYLQGDIQQRYELLHGLLDIDGSTDTKGKVHYSAASEGVKNDILTLCYSLGLCASWTVDKTLGSVNTHLGYDILISLSTETEAPHYLILQDIQDLGYEEEMTCIYVENENHLFLMNDFIVTHNTMLMVVGALELLEHEKFDRIIWIRNNIDVKDTKDLGALPGEVFEKLKPFLGPFIDHAGETRVISMVQDGRLVVEPLQFLRGRNFENSLILCSEAENLTKEHIQLIIARAAAGSEVWFDGDCRQRDKASFEKSQGVEKMIERFKGNPLFGYVYLPKTERSQTAAMADLLD